MKKYAFILPMVVIVFGLASIHAATAERPFDENAAVFSIFYSECRILGQMTAGGKFGDVSVIGDHGAAKCAPSADGKSLRCGHVFVETDKAKDNHTFIAMHFKEYIHSETSGRYFEYQNSDRGHLHVLPNGRTILSVNIISDEVAAVLVCMGQSEFNNGIKD